MADAEPADEEEEQKDDPNVHRLDYEGIEVTKNAEGKTVLNDFLTIEETLGAGSFCKVVKAIGYYKNSDEYVPYALKKYKVSSLNKPVMDGQQSSLSIGSSSLKIKTLRKQVEDEVAIWGTLKHDNVVKAFI